VPVYTIFTNEQLAQMVQSRATTKAALEKIAGVGDARIEKYTPAGRKPPVFLTDGQRQASTVWDQGRPGKFDLIYQGLAD
jgi:hypothetical protein